MGIKILYNPPQNEGGGSGSISSYSERYISGVDQTIFNLTKPYIPNTHNIDVYVEGVLMNCNLLDTNGNILTVNYIETDEDTITFSDSLDANLLVEILYR